MHASLVGAAFLWESVWSPPLAPQPEPIIVELVAETPEPAAEPEPAPPPQETAPEPPKEDAQQEPPPQPEEKVELPPAVPLDLAPAFDAPRSAQNDSELTIGDKGAGPAVVAELKEPPTPEPEQPPPVPAKAAPAPPPPEPVNAEAQLAPQEATPAEPLPPDPDGVPALAQPTPAAKPETENAESDKPEAPDAKRFAFFAPVPKMEFESGAKPSRAPPGNAQDSYTATLYGMIVPLVRVPPGLPPLSRRRPLQVEFVVDGRGRLAGAMVTKSSGVPSLDIAVLYAIRQAAPYPPTPHGKPLPLVLDYEPP
jgi:protein TonB